MNKPRHIRSRKKNTWTELRVELQNLCAKLNISERDFAEVGIHEWKGIKKQVWSRFSNFLNSAQIWNTLSDEYASIKFDLNCTAFSNLINPSEQVWIFLSETVREQTKRWVYQGNIKAFEILFLESHLMNEVMIVSKKYEWLLILDDHDILYGVGAMKKQIEKLRAVANNM
jgi:hypothetical protein